MALWTAMVETPRLFYKLEEFANLVGKTEYELIQVAACGGLTLSVYFEGALLYLDEENLCYRLYGWMAGLMNIPKHEAMGFTVKDTVFIGELTPVVDGTAGKFPIILPGIYTETSPLELELTPHLINQFEYYSIKKSGKEWKAEHVNRPEYNIGNLYVMMSEAERITPYLMGTEEFPYYACDHIEINPKRERTLLKVIGALIHIHYNKNPYKTGEKFNATQIEEHIMSKIPKTIGIAPQTIRKQVVPPALEAIEENFKVDQEDR